MSDNESGEEESLIKTMGLGNQKNRTTEFRAEGGSLALIQIGLHSTERKYRVRRSG